MSSSEDQAANKMEVADATNDKSINIKAVVIVKDTVGILEKLWNLFSNTLLGCLCCIICLCVLRVGSLREWGFSVKVFEVAAFEIMACILFVFSFNKFNILPIKKKSLLLELVSAELDPLTEQEKATIKVYARRTRTGLAKEAIIREYGHPINGDWKYEKYECVLKIPEGFGEVGALKVANEQRHEMFLEDFLLCDVPRGPVRVMIACRSWVHSKFENPEKRIFFTNKSYLPSQTPSGLKKLRKKELAILRGNGEGERKAFERIYDYDTYNDLGNPDTSVELARPVLGSKKNPYPRRIRTGRPQCEKDQLSEKRSSCSSSIYVPREEKFTEVKAKAFSVKRRYSILRAALPTLESKLGDIEKLRFPFISAIEKLFNDEVYLPSLKNKPIQRRRFVKARDETQISKSKPILRRRFAKATIGFVKSILRFDMPASFQKDRFAWLRDEEFSRQTLAGTNPYSIRLVTELPLRSKLDPMIYGPPESKITREIIEREIKGFEPVDEALKHNKLFVLDYHDMFLPYVNQVREIKGTALYGSRTLFFLTPDSTLKVLAIELTRPPVDKKPQWSQVFTPGYDATTWWLWRLAKAHVLAHDSGYHQLVSHWLRTHCCIEPYIIATNRQLSAMHPIYRLLRPHFRYTMEINAFARKDLINADGLIESTFSTDKYSMEISSAAYDQQWQFNTQALPADLINRGLAVKDADAPHGLKLRIEDYPFANDGLSLWDIIKQWVTEYVNHYYSDEIMIKSDEELQEWWTEIRTKGHEDKKDEPGWPPLNTPQNLIEIITTMVWVASGHHASVNFGQYAYAGYFPSRPTIARTKMPTEDPTDEEWEKFLHKPEIELLNCFPSQIQAAKVMVVLNLLSNHSPDEEYIGEVQEPSWNADPVIKRAYESFQQNIIELGRTIDDRNENKSLKNRSGAGILPYELLKPLSEPGVTGKGVPYSISI